MSASLMIATVLRTPGIELECCQSTLLDMIPDKHLNQRDIATVYALALRSSERKTIDWLAVNTAILQRWPKGLTRVKELAWKIAEGRA